MAFLNSQPTMLPAQRSLSVPCGMKSFQNMLITSQEQEQSGRSLKNNNNSAQFTTGREMGLIEKLLHSYGFLQCCNRQGRLFFHFSELIGNPEALHIGDLVEFLQSYDKRTHRPIATMVCKVQNQSMSEEVISEIPVKGTVLSEIKISTISGNEEVSLGQIAYEQNGETFFLPFCREDILDGEEIITGMQVELHIATDDRNGVIRACKIRQFDKQDFSKVFCQGIVCSMKDNFGFIERADEVKEIFFHFSQYKGDIENLNLGDDVEFEIQIRNNKEIALDVHQIVPGTVIFEDVGTEIFCGHVTKTLQLSNEDFNQDQILQSTSPVLTSDPLFGRILYYINNEPIQILFGERDRIGDFTLLTGDLVEFHIATDRRDKLQRATNISILDSTFLNSYEKREKGYVVSITGYSGYIYSDKSKCRYLYHMNELLNPSCKLKPFDQVEFTLAEDITDSKIAIRIKLLPPGNIEKNSGNEFEYGVGKSLQIFVGIIKKKPDNFSKSEDITEQGLILYEDMNGVQLVAFYLNTGVVSDSKFPNVGDRVEFELNTNSKIAEKICVKGNECKKLGFVVCIKNGVAWIELVDQKELISFRSNLLNAKYQILKVGDEIEFNWNNKIVENICLLPSGTINSELCASVIFEGRVIRGIGDPELCIKNPQDYNGIIQLIDKSNPDSSKSIDLKCSGESVNSDLSKKNSNVESSNVDLNSCGEFRNGVSPVLNLLYNKKKSCNGNPIFFIFRISSLMDKSEFPTVGELVRFQPVKIRHNGSKLQAGFVVSLKRCISSKVEAIKGQIGVLNYEITEGIRLNFVLSDVINPSDTLIEVGDQIEFFCVSKNNKQIAAGFYKMSDRQHRPDRLNSKLKNDEHSVRTSIIRLPKGPDGSKGFKLKRNFSTENIIVSAKGDHNYHNISSIGDFLNELNKLDMNLNNVRDSISDRIAGDISLDIKNCEYSSENQLILNKHVNSVQIASQDEFVYSNNIDENNNILNINEKISATYQKVVTTDEKNICKNIDIEKKLENNISENNFIKIVDVDNNKCKTFNKNLNKHDIIESLKISGNDNIKNEIIEERKTSILHQENIQEENTFKTSKSILIHDQNSNNFFNNSLILLNNKLQPIYKDNYPFDTMLNNSIVVGGSRNNNALIIDNDKNIDSLFNLNISSHRSENSILMAAYSETNINNNLGSLSTTPSLGVGCGLEIQKRSQTPIQLNHNVNN